MATIPLADVADRWIASLADATGCDRLAALDGATLLGERAAAASLPIPGRISAGGGCTLHVARHGLVALNLARAADREMLPALFETDDLDASDDRMIAAAIRRCDAEHLVRRGRLMGLAIAAEDELRPAPPACEDAIETGAFRKSGRRLPRVLDLSALWAGPLAAHLLWLTGADVVKVESESRPDAMRDGDGQLFAVLNQGKASVVLDFGSADGRRALIALIAEADIVIEAARPRALLQLGIDTAAIVRSTPGLIWLSLTGHGTMGEAADWVGFGDDCGVAAGLSLALRRASGHAGFIGDAIADPLTGIHAARVAWQAWTARRGGRFSVAMTGVAAAALAHAQAEAPDALVASLRAWRAAAGAPFPARGRQPVGKVSGRGADTRHRLAGLASC